MHIKRAVYPNLITFTNLFLGFMAIILFGQGRFLTGSWLIVIGVLMDGMDGAVARLVKSSSKFGGEVDSLADMVSFGVAPAVLVYHMMPSQMGFWAIFVSAMPMIAAATRLAKYNIMSAEHGHSHTFSGMPTPSAALLFVGFYIYSRTESFEFNTLPIWFTLVPLISLLMVSPIPYRRLPVVQIHGSRRPWLSVAFLITSVVALLVDIQRMLFMLMAIYMLMGLGEWIMVHTGIGAKMGIEKVKPVPAPGNGQRRPFFPRRKK
jgi:CDP-diacylglycerol--serine O-phosphatidyltransferase